jgi:hypothetical protein
VIAAVQHAYSWLADRQIMAKRRKRSERIGTGQESYDRHVRKCLQPDNAVAISSTIHDVVLRHHGS